MTRRRVLQGVGDATAADQGAVSSFGQRISDALQQLDASVIQLDAAESQLYAIHPTLYDPSDLAEWQAEFNKVNAAKSTIQAAQDAANTLASWWQSAKSFVGLSGVRNLSNHLGALPFAIPWGTLAVITGGTAAVVAIVASVNSFVDRMTLKAWNDENIRRSQEGLEPLPRPATTSGGSIFDGATDFGKMAIIGFAAFVLLPVIAERLRR